jgi:hypothetical protein
VGNFACPVFITDDIRYYSEEVGKFELFYGTDALITIPFNVIVSRGGGQII